MSAINNNGKVSVALERKISTVLSQRNETSNDTIEISGAGLQLCGQHNQKVQINRPNGASILRNKKALSEEDSGCAKIQRSSQSRRQRLDNINVLRVSCACFLLLSPLLAFVVINSANASAPSNWRGEGSFSLERNISKTVAHKSRGDGSPMPNAKPAEEATKQATKIRRSRSDDPGRGSFTEPLSNDYELRKDKEEINQRTKAGARADDLPQGHERQPRYQHSNGETKMLSQSDSRQISEAEREQSPEIERSGRSNFSPDPTEPVCGDCLAIPMVALVGEKQVNGFIIQPAPSDLHGRLASHEERATIKNLRAAAAPGQNYRAENNDDNNNNGPMDQIDHQGNARWSSRSSAGGSHATSQPQSIMQARMFEGTLDYKKTGSVYERPGHGAPVYYQTRPYGDRQSLAPVSDEKCPMSGPLTVCDQINSYPADAILRRLDSMKHALQKSYFNIDSLFYDESEGPSEPFEEAAKPMSMPSGDDDSRSSERELASLRAKPNSQIESSYYAPRATNQTNLTKITNIRNGHAEPPTHYKRIRVSSLNDSHGKPRKGTSQDGQIEQTAPPLSNYGEESFGGVTQNRNEQQQNSKALNQARATSRSAEHFVTSGQKFLDLVERRGLNGLRGTLHNLRPARRIMEEVEESGTHKNQANNFSESGAQDAERDNGARGHQVELASTLAPVVSGCLDGIGGRRRRCPRAAVAIPCRAHKQRASEERAAESHQAPSLYGADRLSPNMTKLGSSGAQKNESGCDGDDGGPLGALTSQNQLTSAEPDKGLAKNNQGLQRRQHQLQGSNLVAVKAKSALLSSSPPLAISKSAGEGSVAGIKVATSASSASSVFAGMSSPNLLSSRSAAKPARGSLDKPAEQFVPDGTTRSGAPIQSGHALVAKGVEAALLSGQPGRPEQTIIDLTPRSPIIKARRDDTARERRAAGRERPRRQVPSNGLAMNAEGRDPERTSASTTEPPASDDRITVPQPICRAKSIYISPKAALNDKKQWKYVVNAPERDPRIRQIIRVDVCEHSDFSLLQFIPLLTTASAPAFNRTPPSRAPFEACSSDVTLPLGFVSQCKQKYAKKKLLALDAESGLLEVDTFFIPSCCVCQLIRDKRLDEVDEPISSMSENI